MPGEDKASNVAEAVSIISIVNGPAEHKTKSAAAAETVPAVDSIGTKIVSEAVSEHPEELVTSTATVD